MDQFSAKKDLHLFVELLRKEMNLNLGSYPISTVKLCEATSCVDVDYVNFKTKGICGTAMLGEKVDTIILNMNRSERERNFDCGHEIIHLTHHRENQQECFQCFATPKPSQDPFVEWQANEGSAELLVPYKLLLPEVRTACGNINSFGKLESFKTSMALNFDVSMAVINYRLESLKYEIRQYFSGVPFENINFLSKAEQDRLGMSVPSLNDIFPRSA